jgi:hypothetical protein
MHVQSPAITDPRVMREASALAEANYAVAIVDVERHKRPKSERADGVLVAHVLVSPKSARHCNPVQAIPWLLFKMTRTSRSAFKLIGTRADAYHAHAITALPACYVAASLRRKALIVDAHELPLTQPHLVEKRLVTGVSPALRRLMLRRRQEAIAVSPPLIGEIQRLYGGPRATVELVMRYKLGCEIENMEPETIAAGINGALANPVELAHMRASALAACERELRCDVEKRSLVNLYHRTYTPGLPYADAPTMRYAQGARSSQDVTL